MQEVLDVFLATYRTTPNDRVAGRTPAELFMGRKLRTTLDLLHPPPKQPTERDKAMERQFNVKQGARHRSFVIGQPVFARHHHSKSWKAGRVINARGVVYVVMHEDGQRQRYHANQLRPRAVSNELRDPYAVVMDTFNLPMVQAPKRHEIRTDSPPRPERHVRFQLDAHESNRPDDSGSMEERTSSVIDIAPDAPLTLRRSSRVRKIQTRLQPIPRNKSYEYR